MSEQSNPFEFEVAPDRRVKVSSWDEMIGWLERERQNWDWLARGGETDQPNQWASNVQNQWDQMINSARTMQARGEALPNMFGNLHALTANGQLITADSAEGILVLDIRRTVGEVGAAFAYAFIKGGLEWTSVRRRDALLGVLLTVFPEMGDASELADALRTERKRYRDTLRSGVAKLEEDFEARSSAFDALVQRGKALSLRTLRTRKASWERSQAHWSETANNAVDSIHSVRNAYQELMQLQAPVEYWTSKSATHKTAAQGAARNLAIYFGALIVVLGLAFGGAAAFLLGHTPGPSGGSTALYFVVSAGLAVLSTIGFWVGRLFTRLYLSEHHLGTDADERAVMTKTYLALTNENAATESERQIILTALFRASADGIVRDDGPPDIGVQAVVSKALAR